MYNLTNFLAGYKSRFGPLTQNLIDAITFLVNAFNGDARFPKGDTSRRKIAYILATFKWETAHTLMPIDEHGTAAYFEAHYGPQTATGRSIGNTHPGDGSLYHGRGYVQVTGRGNYARAAAFTHKDLVNHPELMKDQQTSYDVCVNGMVTGIFTGKKLGDYIKDGHLPDFENARRIINGLDKAQTIADLARRFDEVLSFAMQPKMASVEPNSETVNALGGNDGDWNA